MMSCNRGFTIIETVITAAILSFVALAAAGIGSILQHGSDYGDRKNEQSALSSLISQNLQLSTTCDAAMGPASGLNLAVDDAAIRQPSTGSGGWQPTLKLPSLKSGAAMTGTTIATGEILPSRRLKIERLRFADGVEIANNGTTRTYLASLLLKTSGMGSGGVVYQEILVTSLTIDADVATQQVKSCQSRSSTSFQQTCVDMGCAWNPVANPAQPCKCLRRQVVCAAPGYVPVAFTADGLPDCRPMGGAVTCPAGEFLVGVGIDWFKCAPVPSTTPTPAATATPTATPTTPTTPTPAPTPSAQGCYFDLHFIAPLSTYATDPGTDNDPWKEYQCPGYVTVPTGGMARCNNTNNGSHWICGPGMGGVSPQKGTADCRCP